MTLKLDETSLALQRVDGEGTVSALASGGVRLGLGEPEIGRVLSLRALPRLGTASWNEGQAQTTGLVDLVLVYETPGKEGRTGEGPLRSETSGTSAASQSGQSATGQAGRAASEGWPGPGEMGADESEGIDAPAGAVDDSLAGPQEEEEEQTHMGLSESGDVDNEAVESEEAAGRHSGGVLESSVWRDALQFEAWAEMNLDSLLGQAGQPNGGQPTSADGAAADREGSSAESAWSSGAGDQAGSGSLSAAAAVGGARVELKADCQVDSVEYQVDEDGRGLQVEVALSVTFRATHPETVQLVSGVSAGTKRVRLEGQRAVLEQLIGAGEVQQSVRAQLALDAVGRPPARRLLDARPVAYVERVEAGVESVQVQGNVRLMVLYVPQAGDNRPSTDLQAASWPASAPWTAVVPVPGAQAGQKARAQASVAGFNADLGADGRSLDFALDVDVHVDVRALTNLTLLEAVEGEGTELAVAVRPLTAETLVNELTSQARWQQELEVGEPLPGIEQVLLSDGQVKVGQVQCAQDQVQVEGAVDLEMFYIGGGWETTSEVVSWPKGLEFHETLIVPGVHAGDQAQVQAQLTEIQLIRRNSRVVVANVTAQLEVRVVRPVSVDVVVDVVEVPPSEEDPPALRFVLLQPGDTLWRLATRYHTTAEGLQNENPWIASEGLKPGRKVCIPQRILVR